MKLKDADELLGFMFSGAPHPLKAPFVLCTAGVNDFKRVIEHCTTISPDDVRGKAYPVKFYSDPFSGRMFTTCSRCDGKISPKDCYCKHCGARMKEPPEEVMST